LAPEQIAFQSEQQARRAVRHDLGGDVTSLLCNSSMSSHLQIIFQPMLDHEIADKWVGPN
jgi:hypothetical protein